MAGPIVRLGRFLFAFIFILSGPRHFLSQTIGDAASQGVRMASIAVPISGLLAIAGALCLLLGVEDLYLFCGECLGNCGQGKAGKIQIVVSARFLGVLPAGSAGDSMPFDHAGSRSENVRSSSASQRSLRPSTHRTGVGGADGRPDIRSCVQEISG